MSKLKNKVIALSLSFLTAVQIGASAMWGSNGSSTNSGTTLSSTSSSIGVEKELCSASKEVAEILNQLPDDWKLFSSKYRENSHVKEIEEQLSELMQKKWLIFNITIFAAAALTINENFIPKLIKEHGGHFIAIAVHSLIFKEGEHQLTYLVKDFGGGIFPNRFNCAVTPSSNYIHHTTDVDFGAANNFIQNDLVEAIKNAVIVTHSDTKDTFDDNAKKAAANAVINNSIRSSVCAAAKAAMDTHHTNNLFVFEEPDMWDFTEDKSHFRNEAKVLDEHTAILNKVAGIKLKILVRHILKKICLNKKEEIK